MAVGREGASGGPAIDVAPEGHAMVDGPDNFAGATDGGSPDIPAEVATDLSTTPNANRESEAGGVPDAATLAIDVAPDTPILIVIDAPEKFDGLDTSPDSQPSVDMPLDLPERLSADLAPELIPSLVDADFDGSNAQAIDTASGAAGDLAPGAVSWEDFRARCPREPWAGGRYIVDGDLPFDEAGLQRYYNAWFTAEGVDPGNLSPMGATALWPFPDSMALSYCISIDFGDNLAVVEAAMQVATTSWSDRAGLQYTYVPAEDTGCDASDTNVTFDVRPVSGAGYAAVSFFPDSPRSARSLFIDASAFVVGPGGADLTAALRHQLGHTLGFQHEYLWLDPACGSEDSRLAAQIANYDADSVMHVPACRPSESGGTMQTEGDLAGAVAIYGLSPALIAAVEN
jgi:hypothetical protein